MEALAQAVKALQDPFSWARQEKAKGRKVIGVTPMHFPEELIHASGALPTVLQESNEPVTVGYGHLYPFYCGFTRSNVDLAAKGKLGLFDALAVSDMCLQIRHMGHIMRRIMPTLPFLYLQWPLEAKEKRWLNYTVDRLGRFRSRLEAVVGKKIEDRALRESLALYNHNRALLRQVYQIRREKPGLFPTKEWIALVMASMVMPKEEHNRLLEGLIPELKKLSAPADGRVRLFLSGHLCQAAKVDIIDLMEELGAVVVGDDLYTGWRYLATDADTGSPPLEAMARRYLNLAFPCPTRSEPDKDWGQYLVQQARQTGAQGIVVLVVKFCEPHMIYYPHVKSALEAAFIPHLLLETEHEVVSLEGVRTRLQAFMEMLRR